MKFQLSLLFGLVSTLAFAQQGGIGAVKVEPNPAKAGQEERLKKMGVSDLRKVYTEVDLAPGPDLLFVATGVTDGALMRGVRFFGGGLRTSSLIMSSEERLIRFADSVRLDDDRNVVVEF